MLKYMSRHRDNSRDRWLCCTWWRELYSNMTTVTVWWLIYLWGILKQQMNKAMLDWKYHIRKWNKRTLGSCHSVPSQMYKRISWNWWSIMCANLHYGLSTGCDRGKVNSVLLICIHEALCTSKWIVIDIKSSMHSVWKSGLVRFFDAQGL